MRVVVAPDSFKGTIGAAGAAAAIAAGWRDARPGDEVVALPMADGGEGTLDAFATAVPGAERMPVRVTGPDHREIETAWLRLPATPAAPRGTAIVELGATSGLELLRELHPQSAHTFGLGQAIAAALAAGVSRVVVGLGSSASTDGGTGMLRALGMRVLDEGGADVELGGGPLGGAARIDAARLVAPPPGGVSALTDVTNPLLGPFGAARVFGPQKGAAPTDVALLERGLEALAALLPETDPETPGAGAAGGTGFGLLAWGATLEPGSRAVGELIGLAAQVATASVVITGEGSFDGQSAAGKVPAHVAVLAAGGPASVALVAGRITPDADTSAFAASLSLTELAGSPAAAMAQPARWLREAGARLARRRGTGESPQPRATA